MSHTLKDRPTPRKNTEQEDAVKIKDRPARSTVRNTVRHLDPEDYDDMDLEPFEKM